MGDRFCQDCQRLTSGDCGKHGLVFTPSGFMLPDFVPTTPTVDPRDEQIAALTARLQAEQIRADSMEEKALRYDREMGDLAARVVQLRGWVDDLQSGMYVNCVYCGHRYGPGETTPVSMADALKAHVEQCPKHPMSAIKAERDDAVKRLQAAEADRDHWHHQFLLRDGHYDRLVELYRALLAGVSDGPKV